MGPSLCCTASFCGSLSSSKYFGMGQMYDAIKARRKLFVNKILVNLVEMYTQEQILLAVKNQIKEVLPEAHIFLFGSRANNSATEESDWDILVLSSQQPITKLIKQQIHNRVFPLSVSIGSFINVLLVTEKDWQQNPSYYSIKKTIAFNNSPL